MSEVYPWRDGRTVTEVVAAHRSLLVSIGMIEKGPGHRHAELAAWQKRLGQPVPDEVIELYLAARPRRAGEHTDFPSIELFEISMKWTWSVLGRPGRRCVWSSIGQWDWQFTTD
jgi:hypothetical protein